MKKLVSILLAAIMCFTMCGSVFAVLNLDKEPLIYDDEFDAAPSTNAGNGKFDIGTITPKAPGTSESFAAKILGYMQWVGYAIAIGMLIYVGIKYIMASANDKAEIKNALLKYVLGAILIAAATTIAGWIFTAGASLQ